MSMLSLLSWFVLGPVVVFGLIALLGDYALLPLLVLAVWALAGGRGAPRR